MSDTLKRAISRGSVITSGVWVTMETNQRDTLQALQREVESLGGRVIGVEIMCALARTGKGERPNREVYIIDAVLPTDNGIV